MSYENSIKMANGQLNHHHIIYPSILSRMASYQLVLLPNNFNNRMYQRNFQPENQYFVITQATLTSIYMFNQSTDSYIHSVSASVFTQELTAYTFLHNLFWTARFGHCAYFINYLIEFSGFRDNNINIVILKIICEGGGGNKPLFVNFKTNWWQQPALSHTMYTNPDRLNIF